jgi:hypothetical protein
MSASIPVRVAQVQPANSPKPGKILKKNSRIQIIVKIKPVIEEEAEAVLNATVGIEKTCYGGYSRSHVPQGGGEPEGFPRVSLSPRIFVLSLLANTINTRTKP